MDVPGYDDAVGITRLPPPLVAGDHEVGRAGGILRSVDDTMARTVTMNSPVTMASGTTVQSISSLREPKICRGSWPDAARSVSHRAVDRRPPRPSEKPRRR